MLNKVILLGRLGKDPEIRNLTSGGKVATFSLATSESWKDKSSGERQERTQWHNVVVWNEGLVGVVDRYCKKGDLLYVEGQLETRKWQDKDGNDRYSTEVVLRAFNGTLKLMPKGKGGGAEDGREEDRGRQPSSSSGGSKSRRSMAEELDDEIPF
jgi:single-strand DNA-binding protein